MIRRFWPLIIPVAFLLVVAPSGAAQEGPGMRVVTIVNADSVTGEVVNGERIRRLFGNVHLRQDTTDLRASRATQYLDRDLIVFEGRVSIADPGDTLRASRTTYDSFRKIGRAQGDVRLSDAEAVLYSEELVFFRSEKRALFDLPVRLIEREGGAVLTSLRGTYFTGRKEALFEGDVRLEDSTSVLTSDRGRYGTQDKRADFFGDVRLTHQNSTRMRADTLVHFRDTRVSEARGDVAVLRFGRQDDDEAEPDTTRRTLLFGGFAHHDEDARYSRVERGGQVVDPLIARLTTDSLGVTDTLLVRANVFEAYQPDSLDTGPLPVGATLQRMLARGEVRLAGEQLAALADSVVVDRLEFENEAQPTKDDVRLFVEPVAWMNSRGSNLFTQLSGNEIRVTARGESVDSLHVLGDAFAIRPDSALGRNNQIRGRQLLALFESDELRDMRVWNAAEALFFRADSLDQLQGGYQASGDSLSFTFRADELERVFYGRGVEGAYYDAEIIPSPFQLDGPPFTPERRPLRARLLEDRPSLEDPFRLPPPVPQPAEVAPEAPLDELLPTDLPPGLEPVPLDPDERPRIG